MMMMMMATFLFTEKFNVKYMVQRKKNEKEQS